MCFNETVVQVLMNDKSLQRNLQNESLKLISQSREKLLTRESIGTVQEV